MALPPWVNDRHSRPGSRLGGVLLVVLAVLPLAGQEVGFSFPGRVHAETGRMRGLAPLAEELIVAWIAEPGRQVAVGDPVLIYDATIPARKVQEQRLSLAEEQARFAAQQAALRAEIDDLEAERDRLANEMQIAEAKLTRLKSDDPEAARLAALNLSQIESRLAGRETELRRVGDLAAAGQVPTLDLARARLDAQGAASAVAPAQLSLAALPGRATVQDIQRLTFRIEELRQALGHEGSLGGEEQPRSGDDRPRPASEGRRGRPDRKPREGPGREEGERRAGQEGRGAIGQLQLARDRFQREEKKRRYRLEQLEKNLHEAERDARDLTPLSFVEILDQDRTPRLRVDFGPADRPAPDGWSRDAGLAYDPGRGYGWTRDCSTATAWREGKDPLAQGLILVAGRNRWRATLPAGDYCLRIGVGDTLDCHSPLIRLGGEAILCEVELPAKESKTVERPVTIAGDGLTLEFNDDHDKAIRSPVAGTANPQTWVTVGLRITWTRWPFIYVCDSSTYQVRGLIHQDLVDLLTARTADAAVGAAVTGTLPSLAIVTAKRGLAVRGVSLRFDRGLNAEGTVASVGTAPLPLFTGDEPGEAVNPEDLLLREVLIDPPAELRPRLRLGERVDCRITLGLPEPMAALSASRVEKHPDGSAFLDLAAGRRPVTGFALGIDFVLLDGRGLGRELPFAAAMRPPAAGERRHPARLTPAVSTAIYATTSGRIKEMVDDGATVQRGQRLFLLRNPWIEARRNEREDARRRAYEDFQLAVERRRAANAKAQLEHQQKLLAERRARRELGFRAEVDPVALAQVEAAWRNAEAAAAHAQLVSERAAVGLEPAQAASQRHQAALAALQARRARLDLAAQRHANGWTQIREAADAWDDAIEALALRERLLRLADAQEQAERLTARIRFEQSGAERPWEKAYEQKKQICSPVDGRLFLTEGWDDRTRTPAKPQVDFPVWNGKSLAQVLDTATMGVEAELPEEIYRQVQTGRRASVGLEQFPGLRLDASIESVGRAFRAPRDLRDALTAATRLSLRQVFTVTLRFTPPPELQPFLVPGAKAWVVIP